MKLNSNNNLDGVYKKQPTNHNQGSSWSPNVNGSKIKYIKTPQSAHKKGISAGALETNHNRVQLSQVLLSPLRPSHLPARLRWLGLLTVLLNWRTYLLISLPYIWLINELSINRIIRFVSSRLGSLSPYVVVGGLMIVFTALLILTCLHFLSRQIYRSYSLRTIDNRSSSLKSILSLFANNIWALIFVYIACIFMAILSIGGLAVLARQVILSDNAIIITLSTIILYVLFILGLLTIIVVSLLMEFSWQGLSVTTQSGVKTLTQSMRLIGKGLFSLVWQRLFGVVVWLIFSILTLLLIWAQSVYLLTTDSILLAAAIGVVALALMITLKWFQNCWSAQYWALMYYRTIYNVYPSRASEYLVASRPLRLKWLKLITYILFLILLVFLVGLLLLLNVELIQLALNKIKSLELFDGTRLIPQKRQWGS